MVSTVGRPTGRGVRPSPYSTGLVLGWASRLGLRALVRKWGLSGVLRWHPDGGSRDAGGAMGDFIRLRTDHPSKQVGCGCVILPLVSVFVVAAFLLLFRGLILSCVNY